jgi:hypothetical protein
MAVVSSEAPMMCLSVISRQARATRTRGTTCRASLTIWGVRRQAMHFGRGRRALDVGDFDDPAQMRARAVSELSMNVVHNRHELEHTAE